MQIRHFFMFSKLLILYADICYHYVLCGTFTSFTFSILIEFRYFFSKWQSFLLWLRQKNMYQLHMSHLAGMILIKMITCKTPLTNWFTTCMVCLYVDMGQHWCHVHWLIFFSGLFFNISSLLLLFHFKSDYCFILNLIFQVTWTSSTYGCNWLNRSFGHGLHQRCKINYYKNDFSNNESGPK